MIESQVAYINQRTAPPEVLAFLEELALLQIPEASIRKYIETAVYLNRLPAFLSYLSAASGTTLSVQDALGAKARRAHDVMYRTLSNILIASTWSGDGKIENCYRLCRRKAGRGRAAPTLWSVETPDAVADSSDGGTASAPGARPEKLPEPKPDTSADKLEARAAALEMAAAELRELAGAIRKSTRLYTAEDMEAALEAGERRVWAEIASRGRL